MNTRRVPPTKAAGMTLVEILVSVSILSMIVVMFGQILGSVSSTWTAAQEKMDNFAKARSMLNRLQVDLQSLVARTDLPNFGEERGDSVLGFYTMQRGLSGNGGNERALSYVDYRFEPTSADDKLPILRRINECQSYEEGVSPAFLPASTPAPAGTPDLHSPTPLSTGGLESAVALRGLLGFSISFLHGNGKYSSSYYRNSDGDRSTATAVTISMVVADDKTAGVLKDRGGSMLQGLVGDLAIDTGNTGSAKALWDYQLGFSNVRPPGARARIDFDRYGVTALRGIRTFERTFPLATPR